MDLDTKTNRPYLKLMVRIVVTTVLLIWVFRQVDGRQLWQSVQTAQGWYLIILWVASVAFFVIRALKLHLILKQQALHVAIGLLFKVSMINALYGFVLPGFVSSGVKWYILKKATGKGTNIFNGMIYNQLSEIIITSVCALFVLALANPTEILFPGFPYVWVLPTLCSIIAILLTVSTFLVLRKRKNSRFAAVLNYALRLLPARMHAKGQQTLREAATFQNAGWRFHLLMILLTLITQIVSTIIIYMLAAKAANFSIPVSVYVWLTAIVYILGRIPITFANLGIREMVLVNVLALYGVEKSSALLMSMILFSAIVLRAAIGAVYLLHWSLTQNKAADVPSHRFTSS